MPESSKQDASPHAPTGLIAAGHAGVVRVLDGATGRVIWECSLAGLESGCAGQAVSVEIAGDFVLAGCHGHVFALALADGKLAWHAGFRGRGEGATAVSSEASSKRASPRRNARS